MKKAFMALGLLFVIAACTFNYNPVSYESPDVEVVE